MANLQSIIQQLTDERNRIDDAIKTLNSVNGNSAIRPSREQKSAAGRARIAAAQRARWARTKTAQTTPRRRKISAAGLARIRAAQKRRWAKVKAAKK
jgi:hypothetical protein